MKFIEIVGWFCLVVAGLLLASWVMGEFLLWVDEASEPLVPPYHVELKY